MAKESRIRIQNTTTTVGILYMTIELVITPTEITLYHIDIKIIH